MEEPNNNTSTINTNEDISDEKTKMYASIFNFMKIMDKAGWNAKHGIYCGTCGRQTNSKKNPHNGMLRCRDDDEKTKIEQQIIFFMKKYEYDDQSLINEISENFEIGKKQALLKIESVRKKYPNIERSSTLKKICSECGSYHDKHRTRPNYEHICNHHTDFEVGATLLTE